MVSDPLSGRAHHPLHHHLHVSVDGPQLQEPGQHRAVGDQANQLIPERLQAPGISVCPGERRRVLAPPELSINPAEDALQIQAIGLQEDVELQFYLENISFQILVAFTSR